MGPFKQRSRAMKIEFTGRNFTISQAVRKHTQEQFDKIDSILNSAIKAHVILRVEKHHRHVAEVVVHWLDHELTALSDTTDMYMSISQAVDRLRRQALKLKGKIIDRKHHAVPTSVTALAAEPKLAPAKPAPRIIRSRRYVVKPMTPEEAMMEVASDSEQFLVFRDAETERVGVIYKRKDGNFGLIEP
jgi:putative sigma-54 modulation protein